MPTWQDLPFAQQMRDVITEIARKEVNRSRPSASLATVDTIDEANRTCNVIFPGDTTSVPVRMYTIQPRTGGGVGVGDVVLVSGEGASRRVVEVVKGSPFIKAGRMVLSAIETTASAANAFVDTTTGRLYRSTSSRKYKVDIKPADVNEASILKLQPISYLPKGTDDTTRYLGLIAEDLEEIGDPELERLIVRDENGDPDAIHYDRVAVTLIPVIQRLIHRVNDLEGRLNSQA